MKLFNLPVRLGISRRLIPYVMLTSSLALVAIATRYVEVTANARDRLQFENAVGRTQGSIQDRVNTYIALLDSGSGLFAVKPAISRNEFQTYVERLNISKNYPGLQGIGFSQRVFPEQKDELIAKMRSQGLPNFSIYPSYPRDRYHTIIYLEPQDRRNQKAIGYDMFTNSVRRQAMARARDTGSAAASGKVTLVQEIDRYKQAGFLIYVPVYQNGDIPDTRAERQKQLRGFIYSPFRADDFIQGIFGNQPTSEVNFKIYDGLEITPENLLYRSPEQLTEQNQKPRFQKTIIFNLAGRPWTVQYSSSEQLEKGSDRYLIPFIAVSGVAIAFILFAVTHAQVKSRMAAERAAAELRHSEDRFQAFMDCSPTAAWIADLQGNLLYFNRTYTQMFDFTEDAIGRNLREVYAPEFADQYITNIRLVSEQNQVLETVETAPRPNGTVGEFLVYKFPLSDLSGNRLVGAVALDITESRKAEEMVRQSEIRFRTLVEQFPLSIQILSPQGKTLQVNQAWEKLWGIQLEYLKNYDILQDQQLVELGIMPYIQRGFAGEVVTIPPTQYDPNQTLPEPSIYPQSQRWVQAYIYPVKDESGEIREVVLMHEDITERKHAEEDLQESEARFRTLIETTFDGIIIHDHGAILDANHGTAVMFGYRLSELIGKSILELAVPEYHQEILDKIAQNFSESYEIKGVRKDQTQLDLEVVGRTQIYRNRAVRVTAFRDITNRKLLESQLRARAEQLAEANRLKDEFLATLSHELRTPLNAMLGWTQMLAMRKLDEKTFARATETIHRNTRSLTQMIEDLLDVSRAITGKLHLKVNPTPLSPILNSALETVRSAAEAKHLQIHLKIDLSADLVLGDPNRLQQVFWNLLSNAVKFTPEHGQITIDLVRVGNQAQVKIHDTGEGISPDFLPHVFERFRQADGSLTRAHGGLGLGLAIVRHLVELHGGTVSAESPGYQQGSTFVVSLPLMPLQMAALSPTKTLSFTQPPNQSQLLESLSILVVEDETDTRDLLTTILKQCGATVQAVSNVEAALETLLSIEPDLLISDIGLPGKNGYDLIKDIRQSDNQQQIPAIALTAYATEEDRRAALKAGFQAHLAKPIEPQELIEVITELVH